MAGPERRVPDSVDRSIRFTHVEITGIVRRAQGRLSLPLPRLQRAALEWQSVVFEKTALLSGYVQKPNQKEARHEENPEQRNDDHHRRCRLRPSQRALVDGVR
jgi:hypothetical protein